MWLYHQLWSIEGSLSLLLGYVVRTAFPFCFFSATSIVPSRLPFLTRLHVAEMASSISSHSPAVLVLKASDAHSGSNSKPEAEMI